MKLKTLFLCIVLCSGTAFAQDSTQQRVIGVNAEPATCAVNKFYKLIIAPYTVWTGGAAGVCTVFGAGGSSLPATDTTAVVKGSSDNTKLLRFEVDGFTTGTTRVVTFPDANITVARTDAANVYAGAQVIGNPASAAFAVGPNGGTNPVLQVDASVASQAAGLKVTGNASGAGVTLSAISSGSNEDIKLTPKGTGNVVLGNITFTNTASAISVVTPKKYVALLTQSGATVTATVLENSLGGTVVWTYGDYGQYVGTLTGAFPVNKTTTCSGVNINSGALRVYMGRRLTNDTYEIVIYNPTTGDPDDLLIAAKVEILVYP
jgi:hypothetical protein